MIRRLRRQLGLADFAAFACAMLLGAWVTAQLPSQVDVPTSAQVYPDGVDTIRFSHALHASQSCTTCHGAALSSRRAADSLRPSMQVCAGCHSGEAGPALEECSGCHVGYTQRATEKIETPADWRAIRPAPMIPKQPDPGLRFDHSRHVPRMGGEKSCVGCHGAGKPTMPSMESCGACHDGTVAPSTCGSCHPTGANGKLRPADGAPTMLRPDNHELAFLKRHGAVAKSSPDDCMACHVEQDCASCHNAAMAQPFAVHPPSYITIHSVDARSGAGNCSDCHSVQTFCTSCHVRADVTASPPHAPPPGRQYHPAGWLESSASNNHGVMARRDILDCASCHTETDCITCHAGVNPHPPEFTMTCRKMLVTNGRSCGKCHSDLAGLRALCP